MLEDNGLSPQLWINILGFIETSEDFLEISSVNRHISLICDAYWLQMTNLSVDLRIIKKCVKRPEEFKFLRGILSLKVISTDIDSVILDFNNFESMQSLSTNLSIAPRFQNKLISLNLVSKNLLLSTYYEILKNSKETLQNLTLERFLLYSSDLEVINNLKKVLSLKLVSCRFSLFEDYELELNLRDLQLESITVEDTIHSGLWKLAHQIETLSIITEVETAFFQLLKSTRLKKVHFTCETLLTIDLIIDIINLNPFIEELDFQIHLDSSPENMIRLDSAIQRTPSLLFINGINLKNLIQGSLKHIYLREHFTSSSFYIKLLEFYLPRQVELSTIIYCTGMKNCVIKISEAKESLMNLSGRSIPGIVSWATIANLSLLKITKIRYDNQLEIVNFSELLNSVCLNLVTLIIKPTNFLGRLSLNFQDLPIRTLQIQNYSYLWGIKRNILSKVSIMNNLINLEISDSRRNTDKANLDFSCLSLLNLKSFKFKIRCKATKKCKSSLYKVLGSWKILATLQLSYLTSCGNETILALSSIKSSRLLEKLELQFNTHEDNENYYKICRDFLGSRSRLQVFNVNMPCIFEIYSHCELFSIIKSSKTILKEIFFIEIQSLQTNIFEFSLNNNKQAFACSFLCKCLLNFTSHYKLFKINELLYRDSIINSRSLDLVISNQHFLESIVLLNLFTVKKLKIECDSGRVFIKYGNRYIFEFMKLKLDKLTINCYGDFCPTLLKNLFFNSKIEKFKACNVSHSTMVEMLSNFKNSNVIVLKISNTAQTRSICISKDPSKGITIGLNNCLSPFELYEKTEIADLLSWGNIMKELKLNIYERNTQVCCLKYLVK